MPVLIDGKPVDAAALSLGTVGAVLAYVQRQGRMAVELRLDGVEPDLSMPQAVHDRPLAGQVEVWTANPRELALEALAAMQHALDEADAARERTTDLLARNETAGAMAELGTCLNTWQQAQQCVLQSAQLVGVDLNGIDVDGAPLQAMLEQFSEQLRQIRDALGNRDYVLLGDILTYELDRVGAQWREALTSLSCAVARGQGA